MPCVYLPGPAPAVTVANKKNVVFIESYQNRAKEKDYFYSYLLYAIYFVFNILRKRHFAFL